MTTRVCRKGRAESKMQKKALIRAAETGKGRGGSCEPTGSICEPGNQKLLGSGAPGEILPCQYLSFRTYGLQS